MEKVDRLSKKMIEVVVERLDMMLVEKIKRVREKDKKVVKEMKKSKSRNIKRE